MIDVDVTLGSNVKSLGESLSNITTAPAPWVASPEEPKSYFAISDTTTKADFPSDSPARIQFVLSYNAYEPDTQANFVSTPPQCSNEPEP